MKTLALHARLHIKVVKRIHARDTRREVRKKLFPGDVSLRTGRREKEKKAAAA